MSKIVKKPSEGAILDGVRQVMREHLRVEAPLSPETHLLRDLELDSLKQLTLVVELENRFRICFDPGDEDGLETLGDLVRRIAEHLREPQDAAGAAYE